MEMPIIKIGLVGAKSGKDPVWIHLKLNLHQDGQEYVYKTALLSLKAFL